MLLEIGQEELDAEPAGHRGDDEADREEDELALGDGPGRDGFDQFIEAFRARACNDRRRQEEGESRSSWTLEAEGQSGGYGRTGAGYTGEDREGLGETDEEILTTMQDMRAHGITMLTLGQYLAPSASHLTVKRYVHPDVFKMFEAQAYEMGFKHAAVGAMVRSSYHADQQAGHAMGRTTP